MKGIEKLSNDQLEIGGFNRRFLRNKYMNEDKYDSF